MVRPHTENGLHEEGKKIILEWKQTGRLQTGRPRIRWLDDVYDDMKVMNVRNLKELALCRLG
jgi:hypothetical protein